MIAFTDRFVKSLQPKELRYEIQGNYGLRVRVHPTGSKSWIFVYQLNNTRRRIGLGSYPEISVKDAHLERDRMRELIAKGIDPLIHRETLIREQREAEIRESQELTIQALVERYLEEWAKPRKRSWKEDQRILFFDVVPAWGQRKAKDITRRDVRELTKTIETRGPVMARKSLAIVKKMFAWALTEDLIEINSTLGVTPPPPPAARTRVLTERRLKYSGKNWILHQ